MRKLIIITTVICGLIITSSCNHDETRTIIHERDHSLAGSISFDGYYMVAEGSFDGDELDGFQYELSQLNLYKVSDTEVEMFCSSRWDQTTLEISIPLIAVSGKPHDATFDYSTDDVSVTYDNIEYTSVSTTINGWIKEVSFTRSSDSDVATPDYTCNIIINCDLNGKRLSLIITYASPSFYL